MKKRLTKQTQNPCEEFGDDGWLWARTPMAHKADLTSTGKWMLFIPCANAAAGWRLIKEATEKGLLGFSAKVAREDNISPPRLRANTGPTHSFHIYTCDWKDLEDVVRIGQSLVNLGAVTLHSDNTFYYKADLQTLNDTLGSIFQFRPPYIKLESTRGLTELAKSEPAAFQVLSLLPH